jgi:hypothetical protein
MARTRLNRFSIGLVEHSARASCSGRRSRVTVRVSSSPSRSAAAAPDGHAATGAPGVLEQRLNTLHGARGVGVVEQLTHGRALRARPRVGDVALFVFAATLDQRPCTKHVTHRAGQGFAAIDHYQAGAVGASPRSARLASSALHAAAFSLAPSHSPNTVYESGSTPVRH